MQPVFIIIYIFVQIINRSTRTRCEICSKLTIKRRSGVFIVNFEHISHLCSSVSVVNFEHVIAGWIRTSGEKNWQPEAYLGAQQHLGWSSLWHSEWPSFVNYCHVELHLKSRSGPRYASGKQESKPFLSVYVNNYWHGCKLKKQLNFLLKGTRLFSIFHRTYVLIKHSFPDGRIPTQSQQSRDQNKV